MTEPHIDDIQLRNKIIELFEYRLFPMLMQEGGESDDSSIFYEKLIKLQSAIYHLDAHLEANWYTESTKLAWHWKKIHSHLSDAGISSSDVAKYLSHIKKYEKHELELRQGKSPLRFDLEYFYFYKSCDVKLLRRLIYEHFKLSPIVGSLADWRYYDLITEVNDDIEDIYEDLDYINGNRFLLTVLNESKEVTKHIFGSFLDIIAHKATEKFNKGNKKFNKIIFEMTVLRINETRHLLDQRLNNLSRTELNKAKLLYHLSVKI